MSSLTEENQLAACSLTRAERDASNTPNMGYEQTARLALSRVSPGRSKRLASETSREGASAMSSSAEHAPVPNAVSHVSAEEQVRQQGILPIASVDELAFPGVWESDEELDEFLADLYASRRASVP
jgi:hypothetical protein